MSGIWPRRLAHNLKFEGYDTTVVGDGEAALERLAAEDFDLVVLDVMLPGISGFDVCERLREAGNRVPVLFLTARNTDADRLAGLRHGGDDYMTKPFLLEELVLRIRGILRRQEWYQTPVAERGIFQLRRQRGQLPHLQGQGRRAARSSSPRRSAC